MYKRDTSSYLDQKPWIWYGVQEYKVKEFTYLSSKNVVLGLRVLESGCITNSQLESVKKVLQRSLKKKSVILFNVICDKTRSKKPLEVRMGKGKGGFRDFVCLVAKGRLLVEICSGASVYQIRDALSKAAEKLPLKCKVEFAKR